MALSVFDDKSQPPGPAELKRVLGTSAALWERLIKHVAKEHAPIAEQWNFAGAKYGWSLRLKRRERVVLYLTPQTAQFLVGVVLGEKAVEAARTCGLPDAVLALIDSAPRYAEGRGVRLTVATAEELRAVQQLAAVKLAR